LFYAVFASGELQPWAEPPKDEKKPEEEPVKPAEVPMAPWNPFGPSQQQKVPYSADTNN
jgi:ACS family sodium-dependent inorganic phosphate cotransporter-like MFS transporter 6/7/8